MFTKDEIEKEYLKGKSKRYSESTNEQIKSYIESQITLNLSHKEKVYCYLNDILPKCKVCDNITSFNNFVLGFKETCSNSCSVKLNKKRQEKTRVENIQKRLENLSIEQIIEGLYNKTIKVQKWRDIEKLSGYTDFKTIDQIYKHVILKENQICKYCNKVFDIDRKNNSLRVCLCLTSIEKRFYDLMNLSKKDFLERIVEERLYLYSESKNNKIKEWFYSIFEKKSENLIQDIHMLCKDYNIEFNGWISQTSNKEKEIVDFIKTFYSGEILENYRNLGKELDIYIPEKKVAIEFNGLYWHSSKFKDKKYHLQKTELCENNNIQLIHVFENEWENKRDIVKSIIKAKLGFFDKKIFARKLSFAKIDSKISNEFLNENHIQGADNSPHRYGLFNGNELVQIMTFKRSHRSKTRYMELKRSCVKLGYNVVGGFTKLLKYAVDDLKEDIVTFADRRFSYKENVYSKNNFELIDTTQPNYFYIVNGKLESREKYQKHKLSNILSNFNADLSEKENMLLNNVFSIHDSGNYKYMYKITIG